MGYGGCVVCELRGISKGYCKGRKIEVGERVNVFEVC